MLKLKPVGSFDVSRYQHGNRLEDFICHHEFEIEYESNIESPLIIEMIGTVSVQVVDVDAAVEAGISMRNLLESDVQLSWMYETFFDKKSKKNDFSKDVYRAINKNMIRSKKIVNLELIEINSQFRGYGFGLMVASQLIKIFRQGGGLFAAGVFPTGLQGDSKRVQDLTKKIKKSYESMGLRQVGRSDWLIRDLCEPISFHHTGWTAETIETKHLKSFQNLPNQP